MSVALTQYRIGRYCSKALSVVTVEALKLRRDPTELLARAVQPTLWLVVFGQVFTKSRAIPTGSLRYEDFMAPGILAQSVLFTSIFYGLSVIWERDLGILHKALVSPTPRSALVAGKALSAGVRGVLQATFVYALALILGVKMSWNPLNLLGVAFGIMLGAACFSTFSLMIACIVRSRERFMGVGQLMTMPLFFASNAIYPISMMPGWLQAISHANPLTYQVDMLRALMLAGVPSSFGVGLDAMILGSATIVLVAITSRMYPSLAR